MLYKFILNYVGHGYMAYSYGDSYFQNKRSAQVYNMPKLFDIVLEPFRESDVAEGAEEDFDPAIYNNTGTDSR